MRVVHARPRKRARWAGLVLWAVGLSTVLALAAEGGSRRAPTHADPTEQLAASPVTPGEVVAARVLPQP